MKETPSIEIRIAAPEDRGVVYQLFLEYLEFVDRFDHDVLPTPRNATYFTDQLLMPAAARGDPVLVAWEGGQPIGALFWVIQETPYQSRWRMAYGYGTYLREGQRSKRLGTEIRTKGIEILKAKGVQRLVGMVHFKNEVSIKASDRFGFVPHARLDLLDLDK